MVNGLIICRSFDLQELTQDNLFSASQQVTQEDAHATKLS
jgi:hypothetical protein